MSFWASTIALCSECISSAPLRKRVGRHLLYWANFNPRLKLTKFPCSLQNIRSRTNSRKSNIKAMCHHHNHFTRQAMYVQLNTEVRSCNHCHSGKAISITYSDCVFLDLGIQHAMHIRHIILSSVACLALQYFSTLPHSGTIFEKSYSTYDVCFQFSLQLLSEIILILRKNESDMIRNVYWFSSEVPIILFRL